jgi:hypothetical protein
MFINTDAALRLNKHKSPSTAKRPKPTPDKTVNRMTEYAGFMLYA